MVKQEQSKEKWSSLAAEVDVKQCYAINVAMEDLKEKLRGDTVWGEDVAEAVSKISKIIDLK